MSSRSKYIWSFLGIAAFALAFILDVVYWNTKWKDVSPSSFFLTILLIIVTGLFLAFIPFRRTSYKERLIIGISTASILFLGYRIAAVVDFEFGLTDEYNYFTARQDVKQGKVQIISIGLPMPTGYEAEETAIERDFGYKSIWGCTYSSKGYYWYNAVMYQYLDKRNGQGWENRLRQRLNSLKKAKGQGSKLGS